MKERTERMQEPENREKVYEMLFSWHVIMIHSRRGFLHWSYIRLDLPSVNHGSLMPSLIMGRWWWGLTPPCWTVGWWWILGAVFVFSWVPTGEPTRLQGAAPNPWSQDIAKLSGSQNKTKRTLMLYTEIENKFNKKIFRYPLGMEISDMSIILIRAAETRLRPLRITLLCSKWIGYQIQTHRFN